METNFVGRKTRKDYSCSEKMRNASGHRSKNEQQWEKVNRNIYNISSKKCETRKFLEVVVVQNNGKEMYKKVWLHVQSCFFFC